MIVVSGSSSLVLPPGARAGDELLTYLKQRKSRKFMGMQDELAVTAAGRALDQARLRGTALGERCGLFAAIGYIPFEDADIAPVLEASLEQGQFDVRRFGREGYQRAHPLLTFRCLPNMPAYHVSVNFDVQGRYFVSYPGPGQLYLALEEAAAALEDGEVDLALVLAVAHQSNFLVQHHFERSDPPVAGQALRDVAGCLVLERADSALARQAPLLAELAELSLGYAAFDPLAPGQAEEQGFDGGPGPAAAGAELGPAGLLVGLHDELHRPGRPPSLTHRLRTRDGLTAHTRWRLPS